MFLFDEKRKLTERRGSNDGPPAGCRERRNAENRRQTEIAEITLHEWARHFVKFQECAALRASQLNPAVKRRA